MDVRNMDVLPEEDKDRNRDVSHKNILSGELEALHS
jgi:hypothetical protein